MRAPTERKSSTVVIVFVLALAACTRARDPNGDDAGMRNAEPTDASARTECLIDSDCALARRGCCTCPAETRDNTRAVPASRVYEVEQAGCPPSLKVSCVGCTEVYPDPLAPVFKASCVAQHCELVDLRTADLSRCDSDTECEALDTGCCPKSSATMYVGVNRGAVVSALQCFNNVPPCNSAPPGAEPLAFCAHDGHCALGPIERVDGEPSRECFSPAQNLEQAGTDAVGCDCNPGYPDACRKDADAREVDLRCDEVSRRWTPVTDPHCGLF